MPRRPFTLGMRFTLTKGWPELKRFTSTNSSRPRTRMRVLLPSSTNDHRNGQANRKREGGGRHKKRGEPVVVLPFRPPDVPHALVGRGRLPRLRILRVDFF